MTLDQLSHHAGFARGAKCGADFLGLLDTDQAVDDVAARHQQAMHLTVDRIDLLAQFGERGRSGGRLGHRRTLVAASSSSAGGGQGH